MKNLFVFSVFSTTLCYCFTMLCTPTLMPNNNRERAPMISPKNNIIKQKQSKLIEQEKTKNLKKELKRYTKHYGRIP